MKQYRLYNPYECGERSFTGRYRVWYEILRLAPYQHTIISGESFFDKEHEILYVAVRSNDLTEGQKEFLIKEDNYFARSKTYNMIVPMQYCVEVSNLELDDFISILKSEL